MNRARRRRSASLWAVLLAATGIALSGTPASAAVAPGQVLTSTTATLPTPLNALATGKRISYVTTTVTGSTTAATGLVLTPKTGKKNKTVAWGHGTTGLADQCTPSLNQAVFWTEARDAVAALLKKGFTVTAPDYPGLGTAEAHPYLIGASEARSIIDSVKAARQLDSALTVDYAVDGHSQGGQGALFAGEIAPSYDGALVLRGVSAIAPVSNADLLAQMVPGTPANGYLVMGLYGLQAVDPSVVPNSLLAPTAKTKTSVLKTGCLNEVLAAYASLTANQLLVGGALPASVVAKLVHYDSPAQVAPSAPILLVQGTADEAVPYDLTAFVLLEELNTYAQSVLFVPVEGATHDTAVTQSATLVADWIAGQFA